MNRESILKIVLAVVGVLFLAMAYPMVIFARHEPALSMMMSLYATLGIFLLLAVRNPAAHRSLIAFAAWSSLAHASLMAVQAALGMIARRELIGVAVFTLIWIVLVALPARAPVPQPALAR
jgi:branched-subunit amino acid transport protein AzlD